MSDLEQKIREAAEKYEREEECEPLFHASDILALLAEKDAEIERLRGLVVHGDGSCDRCGKVPAIVMPTSLCDECIEGIKSAESAERERDELKRIAGDLADQCELLRKYDPRPFSERLQNQKAIDAYDVLAGKGE